MNIGCVLVWGIELSYAVDVDQTERIFSSLLKFSLQMARVKNSRFSMRAFAKKLGISSGTLSEVLSGKLTLSQSRMKAIVNKLDLPEAKKTKFFVSMGELYPQKKVLIAQSDQDFLADWLHRAILHYFEIEDLDRSSKVMERIAKRLNISIVDVENCVAILTKKNLLTRQESGRFERPTQFWETSDNLTNEFVRKHHLSNLEAARRALLQTPTDQRDFTSLMFAGTRQQLEELRAEIRSFYDRALAIMEDGQKDEVFQISVNVYPLGVEDIKGARE